MRDFSIDIIWAKLQMAIAAVGGWLGYFLGGMDGLLHSLFLSGTIKAGGQNIGADGKTDEEAVLQRGL